MIVLHTFTFECNRYLTRSFVLKEALKVAKAEYENHPYYQVQAVAIDNVTENLGLDIVTKQTRYMEGQRSYDIAVYGHVIDPLGYIWGNDE